MMTLTHDMGSPASGVAKGIRTVPGDVKRRVTDAVKRFVEGFRAREAERYLATLDDRMLKDVGVSRGDIGRVVRCGRD